MPITHLHPASHIKIKPERLDSGILFLLFLDTESGGWWVDHHRLTLSSYTVSIMVLLVNLKNFSFSKEEQSFLCFPQGFEEKLWNWPIVSYETKVKVEIQTNISSFYTYYFSNFKYKTSIILEWEENVFRKEDELITKMS